MKPVTRYFIHVLLLVMFLQAMLVAATFYHAASRVVIDTYKSFGTIYTNGARMAVYSTPIIARQTAQPQLIIFGSSDAFIALRPEQVSALTNVAAHNLSVPGHNVTAFTKLLDLLYQQTPRENWPNLNIVVAVSATALKSDALHWKDGLTDVEHEMLRYGAFDQTQSGLTPRLGAHNTSMLLQLVQPFMLPAAGFYEGARLAFGNAFWTEKIFKRFLPLGWWYGIFNQWFPDEMESNIRPVYTAKKREQILNYINDYMGPEDAWNNKGFEQLEQMAARVNAAGGNFFLVDLPTAAWWHNGMRFHSYYQKHKLPYIARMQAMPGVHYINIQDGFADDAFFDGAHMRANVRPEVARRVAEPINRALAATKAKRSKADE